MSNDFQILIGADTSQMRYDITSTIDAISSNYPIGLRMYIENYGEVVNQVNDIQRILSSLGSINISLGNNNALNAINSSLNNISRDAERLSQNMENAFNGATSGARDATKEAEKLLKVTQKIDAETKKPVSQTIVTGDDYRTVKSSFSPNDDGKMSLDLVEENLDFKKLQKFISEIENDLERWTNPLHKSHVVVDEHRESLSKLTYLASDLTEEFGKYPEKFSKTLAETVELRNNLKEIENIIDSQIKKQNSLQNKYDNSKLLDTLKPSDREWQNVARYMNNLDFSSIRYGGEGDNQFDGDYQMAEMYLEKAIARVKELNVNQKLLEKATQNVKNNIEDWSEKGHLTQQEMQELLGIFQSLDIRSSNFTDELNNATRQAISLGNKEKEIINKKIEAEETLIRQSQERVNWESKINTLEREGYTHNGQMKALKTRLNKLTEEEIKDAETLNKLLAEMNAQYKKATDYQKNLKAKITNVTKTNDAKDKLSKIDTSYLDDNGLKEYEKMSAKIEKLGDFKNLETQQKLINQINEHYKKLLASQNEGIEKQKIAVKQAKEELEIQKALQALEEKSKHTKFEQAKLDHEMQEKAWKENNDLANKIADKRETREFNGTRNQTEFTTTNDKARKEAEKHNAELLRQYENQQRINKEFEKFKILIAQISSGKNMEIADFDEAVNAMKSISKESKNLEKDFERVYDSLADVEKKYEQMLKDRENVQKHLGQMERNSTNSENARVNSELERRSREAQDLIDQMARGREQSEARRQQEDRVHDNRMDEARTNYANSQLDKQYQNQLRINAVTEEFNRTMSEISSKDMFDDADLAKARQMISQLNKESETLESELKQIRDEFKAVNREISNRQKSQTSISNLQNRNSNSANSMASRGVVPEHLIEGFRDLNNMLDFKSTEEDIAIVASEMNRLLQLEEQLNQELKESERWNRLIAQAKQDMIKRVDVYSDKLDRINNSMLNQLRNQDNIESSQREINALQERLVQIRQRGDRMGDEEVRDINRTIDALQENIRALRQQEKQVEKNEEAMRRLNDKLESHLYRATRGINDNRRLVQIQNMYEGVRSRAGGLDANNADFSSHYNDLLRQLGEVDRESANIRDSIQRSQHSLFGRIGYSMKQVPIWMGAMSLFYGSMMQVRQGFQSLLDIDKSMINLQKVTEATNAELEHFKHLSAEIGSQMGVTSAQVIDSTTEFQKLGYSLQESTALARNSILYANVGDMAIEDATTYMVSSIKGFNIEVDKSGKNVQALVDMFNEVSNNFAITSEGIGQALQRSSAVLTQAGNSIEQSVALITSANTTIQDPMKVGNALKTISMRLRGVDEEGNKVAGLVPELEKTFNSFGSSIMENEDTFKTTYDIMDELQEKWDTLSDMEQANITELIGGKEQGSIVASMIANWDDAEGALETAMNSSGSALREFENYTQGFEYKINRLKVAMEEFWVALVDSDAVKNLIDGLTGIVNIATKAVDTFGSLPILIGTLVPLFLTVSSTMRNMIVSPDLFRNATNEITTMWASSERGAKKATTAVQIFSKALWTLMSRVLLITGAIMALTWIGGKIVEAINHESNARQKLIETMDDEITKYEDLKEKMDSVDMNRFNELRDMDASGNLGLEEKQELLRLNAEITNSLPELISHYDSEGKAVIRSREEIEKYLEAKEKENAMNLEKRANAVVEEADYGDLEKQISKVSEYKDLIRQSKEEEDAYSMVQEFIEKNINDIEQGGEEIEAKFGELYKKIDESIDNGNLNKNYFMSNLSQTFMNLLNTDDIDGAIDQIDKQAQSAVSRSANLNREMANAMQEVSTYATDFSNHLSEKFEAEIANRGIDVKSNDFLLFNELKEHIQENIHELGDDPDLQKAILEDFPAMLDELIHQIDVRGIDVNKLINASEFDASAIEAEHGKLSIAFDKNTTSGKLLASALASIRNEQISTANTTKANPINPFGGFESEVIPVMDNYMNEISQLDSAYRQLADGQQLSINQIFELIKTYPQLAKQLEYQNGALTLNKKAIMELAKVKEQEFKQDLQTKKVQAENAMKKARTAVAAILLEAKAIQKLEEINAKVIKTTLTAKTKQAQSNSQSAQFARQVGETEIASQISSQNNQLRQEISVLRENYNIMTNLESELGAIEALMNVNYSSNLGSIGSISSGSSGSGSGKGKASEQKKELTDMIYVADKYEQTLAKLNSQISILQAKRESLQVGSKDYINNLNEELKLQKQKKSAVDGEIASLQKQISTKKIQEKGLITLSKEDNKTARAKQAELKAELDELQKELYNLQSESASLGVTINEFKMMLIDSQVAMYNMQRDEISDDIAYFEYMMELYEEGSEGFKKFQDEKIKYLKESQKYWQAELDYLERQKETNLDLNYNDIIKINEAIREARKNLYDANTSVLSETQSQQEINVDINLEAFDKGLSKFEDKIDDLEYSLNKVDDEDYSERVNQQTQIAQAYKGQSDYIQDVIKELTEMKANAKGNHKLIADITDEIEKWEDELKKTNRSFEDSKDDIKKIYEELADATVEIHKESIQHQIDALEKMHEQSMEQYQKEHDVKMKQYEKELSILSKIYDKQIEMINREDETRTYDNTLEKLRKEAEKLQAQIDLWSMDNSFESATKRGELEEELAKKKEEIDDLQYDREKQLRIDSLEDAKDAETEKLEDARDIYEEQYNKFAETQDKMHQKQIESLQDQLNNEAYYAQMRLNIIQGHLAQTADEMEIWQTTVGGYVTTLGDTVVSNFTKKITDAIKEFKELEKVAGTANPNKGDKVTTITNEKDKATSSITQDKDSGALGSSSGNKEYSSDGREALNNAKETKYSKPKIVKAKWECTLFKEPLKTNSGKIRQLAKSSQWKAYGEMNGFYNLGGGWSDKGNFEVVGTSNSSSSGGSSSGSSSGGSSSGSSSGSSNSKRYHTVVKGDTMGEIAQKFYGSSSKWTKIRDANPNVNPNKMQVGTKLLIPFKTGGYTGDWSGDEGRLAILHKKEQVLNETQTEHLFKTIKSLESMQKVKTPIVNEVKRDIPVTTTEVNNEYNLTLQIDKLGTSKREVDIVGEQLIKAMKRSKGGRFD